MEGVSESGYRTLDSANRPFGWKKRLKTHPLLKKAESARTTHTRTGEDWLGRFSLTQDLSQASNLARLTLRLAQTNSKVGDHVLHADERWKTHARRSGHEELKRTYRITKTAGGVDSLAHEARYNVSFVTRDSTPVPAVVYFLLLLLSKGVSISAFREVHVSMILPL